MTAAGWGDVDVAQAEPITFGVNTSEDGCEVSPLPTISVLNRLGV